MDDNQEIDILTLYDPLVTVGESLQVRNVRTKSVKRFITYVAGLSFFLIVLLFNISKDNPGGIIVSSIMAGVIIFLAIDDFFPKKPSMIVEPAGITLENKVYAWTDFEAVIYEKDVVEGYDYLAFYIKNNRVIYFPLYIEHDQSLKTIANYILKYYKKGDTQE
jgi:hypothetical protein